ncbi:uridine kinase [Acholeplasma morum]|uniref:nucleoside kinase n=1 Tax=Paracholeplasma morum TaxID=264637 RepID=UPI00195B1404|nr:nucleoside kinase [Paracholeplasma morum]MBM7453229.1 uridine kinase [Paracholeplasma morum]
MIKIVVNKKQYEVESGTTLEQLKKQLNLEAYAATVNNRIRELTFPLTKNSEVQFLDLTDRDAVRIYESTLRYVISMAVKNLYPEVSVKFNYSVSRAILGILDNLDHKLDRNTIKSIDSEIQRIIEQDLPIERKTIDLDEAIEMYRSHGYLDKVNILKYRDEDKVNMYTCEEYFNYMFGYMLPSTGYLKEYALSLYHPGFIIQYPRSELGGIIPPFDDAPIFSKTIKEATKWGKNIDGDYIHKLNQYVEKGLTVELINMCETKHNRQMAELGERIYQDIDSIRLIAIAGPSSSGKTTFSTRLRIELLSRGIKPLMISIDDYYQPKDQAPKDQFGNPDLEHIEALDISLFDEQMLALIQGEEVTLPHFNFKTGRREAGRKVKISEATPIIIEGIHALNDRLTSSIPQHQKFKVFIAPQTQLHIDDQNPISFTDLRLLRRIVRDQKFRNSPADETISMWASVRRGEFKWIYPYQETANYVFNSELTYELAVLKKHAYRTLNNISRESEHFITANRLLKFLKYFIDIEDDLVPNNSLLREFIGGSVFHV